MNAGSIGHNHLQNNRQASIEAIVTNRTTREGMKKHQLPILPVKGQDKSFFYYFDLSKWHLTTKAE